MIGLSSLAFGIAAHVGLMETEEPASSRNAEHPHAIPKTPEDTPTDEKPLSVELVYSADVWRAASGGLSRGTRYLDNVDVLAEADLTALIGWRGAKAFVYALYNNGNTLSTLMGDAQVASNIETGVKAFRL